MSQDRSVSVVAAYRLDDWHSVANRDSGFSLPTISRLACVSTSLLFSGYQGLFPLGIEWLECETDHSLPSYAKVSSV
jgi:hypothetical protein